MTISDVIAAHFDEFWSMVRRPDVVVEEGKTSEDIFQSAIYTCLKKFSGDVDEKEAYDYIRKTLLTEFYFSPKRKKRDILVLTDSDFSNIPDETIKET